MKVSKVSALIMGDRDCLCVCVVLIVPFYLTEDVVHWKVTDKSKYRLPVSFSYKDAVLQHNAEEYGKETDNGFVITNIPLKQALEIP